MCGLYLCVKCVCVCVVCGVYVCVVCVCVFIVRVCGLCVVCVVCVCVCVWCGVCVDVFSLIIAFHTANLPKKHTYLTAVYEDQFEVVSIAVTDCRYVSP